jgi:predicted dehydrogenase
VLGDLASHGVDLAWYLLGDIESLVADSATFLTERARPTGATTGHGRATGGEVGPVENEDYLGSLLRFASGARATLDASRVAVGEQNNYGFEIHGTKGAVFWDFRRMGELGVSVGTAYQDQSVSTVYVGPAHGTYGAFQPGSATSMSYDDLKVIEAYEFLRSVADGTPHGATLDDAVRSAAALDAMAESVVTGTWVSPVTR